MAAASELAHDAPPAVARPSVKGKFLFAGDEKLYVRGVTYGTFGLDSAGNEIHDIGVVERDFAAMAAHGINAVRVYTVPPVWLLDAAWRHGLRVMVGLPWEQHVDFLAERERADAIERRVRESVRACAAHPALLCFAIGNEVPAPIVRWLGARRVEAFLERLYLAVKAEDPDALVTYVNYPSTEYLRLPFVDILCFNVYLESQEGLDAYLARLHNLGGDRPVIMGEIGLDSRRNGEETQADALDWQVRSAFAAGCAGAFVFAWTDAWHRGGHEITDWDFGLTRRDRRPKPALEAVSRAFAEVPFPPEMDWPRVSVVCCSYNGHRTIRDTLAGLRALRYPDYEVIVVDDGSTADEVARIVCEYPEAHLIRTENRGLSAARNTGMQAATGEIVAYIDDDAFPDPHWLHYIGAAFRKTDFVGVGGPNIPLADDGPIADCVAHAPGGPVHVLLSDTEAEHIPGCNMAFRKSALEAIGGFDPQFRAAGDDVDLCWRLQERGGKLGFSPAALVWHHRRNSVKTYWRQQRGYGKAEAMLERKWPEKYNTAGHIPWAGRIYASYLTQALGWRNARIYHGTWGTALFQSVYQPAPSSFRSLLMMPEWYLVIFAFAALSAVGVLWEPLLLALPFLGVAIAALVTHAASSAWGLTFPSLPSSRRGRFKRYTLTTVLHIIQPLARLNGRLREGLTPWRRVAGGLAIPRSRSAVLWSERWQAPEARLHALESSLRAQRATTARGGDFDRWDLEVRGGMLGAVRLFTTVEEHGAGRQLTRIRIWPWCSGGVLWLTLLFAVLASSAVVNGAVTAAVVLGALAAIITLRPVFECARAMSATLRAIQQVQAVPMVAAPAAVAPGEREVGLTIVVEGSASGAAGDESPTGKQAPVSRWRAPLAAFRRQAPPDGARLQG